MKTVVVSVLVVILIGVLALSAASADEILFRSIPWFQDYETVMAAFSDSGITWYSPSTKMGQTVSDEIEQHSSNSDMNYPCICTVKSKSTGGLKVAGYDINYVELFFVYTPNSEGKIDHKIENTSFYLARYSIIPKDYEAAMTDLKSKLTNLYGTVKSRDNSDECASGNAGSYLQWDGDNSTRVVIIREDNPFLSDYEFYIFYANDGGTSLIKNAEKLQRQEELNNMNNAGSDGL